MAPKSLEANEAKKDIEVVGAWRRWLDGCEKKWELGFSVVG